MEHYKSQRQRQLDNVQKELLSNYYLQKYNTIMSKINPEPENQAPKTPEEPKETQVKSHRLNFKNMILMKKTENHHMVNRHSKMHGQPDKGMELVHKYSSRDEQQNKKMIKKLQESIIKELYSPSPAKIEQGTYKKIQINNSTERRNKPSPHKVDLKPIPIENIQITYDEQQEYNYSDKDDAPLFQEDKEKQKVDQIKAAIKLQFERRKQGSLSPRKNSETKSSKISMQIKIQSPKRLQKSATPNRSKSKFESKQKRFNDESSQDNFEGQATTKRQVYNNSQPHVHFAIEPIEPLGQSANNYQEQIEFVPPTSNYYKSSNHNLVEESFKFQEEIRGIRDQDSEKAKSIASSRKSSRKSQKEVKLQRSSSKNSIRSRQKSSSKMEKSFISKMSMLSSEDGYLIKEKIQKELYDNELGPYQSALYNILQLIDRNPRSGPIYAVGQKTLDDRKIFQERRISQQSQISNLKKNIQKLRKKSSQLKLMQSQEKIIKNNQLQINRLIRKIASNL